MASADSESPASTTQEEAVIEALLEHPAPPPDWREYLKRRPQPAIKTLAPDAPITAVLDYWRSAPETADPDTVTRGRLLEACEAAPEEFPVLRQWLALDSPDVQDRLKKIYDRIATERTHQAAGIAELLREELMHHSHYFREELTRRAFLPGDIGETEATRSMASLIRFDRTGARTLLLKKSSDRDLHQRVLAITTLLQGFRSELATKDITALNLEIERLAADRKSPTDVRRRALLQATSVRTPEMERWFLGLFRDQSLNAIQEYSAEPTPLGEVVAADPDYWIPKVAALVGNADPATHANAVYALIQFRIEKARADALRPLLPWLDDPAWALDSKERLGRLRLIQSLDRVDLPEAVPGLLKVARVATGYELEGAAEALAHHGAREAIEPLKRGLAREKDFFHQQKIARQILKLNGFSHEELVEALKTYALKMSSPAGRKEMDYESRSVSTNKIDYRVVVGKEVVDAGLSDDAAAKAVLEEAAGLAATNPAAADLLRQFVAKWQVPSASKEVVDRLRAGKITAEWVKELIENRVAIAASLVTSRDLKGAALGVQAALTTDSSLVGTVLAAPDRVAQRALLAVARLARVELPIEQVSKFLASSDGQLVRAAELYLESKDTVASREALRRHFKDQARILGGQPNFTSDPWPGTVYKLEGRLRELVLREDGPREIHALMSSGTWGGRGQRIVLVYQDRVVLRFEDGNGRSRERAMPQPEFAALRDWLASERIDDLPPYDTMTADGVQYVYLHLSRAGGRRVYMNNPPGANAAPRVEFGDERASPDPAIYGELTRRFDVLSDEPRHVIYESLAGLPGFRVIHPGEKGVVAKIVRHGDQLLAGIRVPSRDATEWHLVENESISKLPVPAPAELTASPRKERYPEFLDSEPTDLHEGPFAGKQLWPGTRMKDDLEGLWVSTSTGKPELIAKGIFAHPIVCQGGEWIVAAKTFGKNMWSEPNGMVRLHLPTRRVFPIDLPPADTFNPLAWIAAHQRVLLLRQRDDPRYLPPRDKPHPDVGPEKAEFSLLDPTTGEPKRIVGEFRPLQRLEGHALQATGKPNEFWAVIVEQEDHPKPTSVLGRYDTLQFRFTETLRLPAIWFNSWDVHVDEPAGAIWIAVNGDLLRLSLPSNSPPSK